MVSHALLTALLVLAQDPAASGEANAPPSLDAPAATPDTGTAAAPAATDSSGGDNAPPALFDPAAEAASQQRDQLVRRIVTVPGAGVAGVGAGILALGWTALLGGVAAGLYAQERGSTPVRLAGTLGIGLGSVVLLLGLPVAALGISWFTTAFVALTPEMRTIW